MVRDIYNIERSYTRSIKKAKQFRDYIEYLLSQGISKNRIIKILSFLRQSRKLAGRSLKSLKERELIQLLAKIQTLEISGATRNDYIIILRGYFRFIYRHQKRKSEEIRELMQKRKCDMVRKPKFLIQKQHMASILRATDNQEVKLILCLLQETGARIGEILNISKADILFQKNYAILQLDGKTGPRQFPVIENATALRKHARIASGVYLFHQNYASFKKHLNEIRKKLGWPELYPHQFRKSRATYLLDRYPEQIVKKLLGHTPDSRAFKHYFFPTQEEINQAYLSGQLSRSRILNSSAASRKYNRSAAVVPLMPRSSVISMRRFRSY